MEKEKEREKLHILMLPWLAISHLIPFLELSKRLAQKGIKVSFFSTPSSILRLSPIPETLIPFLTFIPCSLPPIENLPSNVENTVDVQSDLEGYLFYQAYASFEHHLVDFLSNPSRPKPDWIIYDFTAAKWAPSLASRFNLKSAFFSIFNAATSATVNYAVNCKSPEELTKIRDLLPFATTVAFRTFEARQIFPHLPRVMSSDELQKRNQLLLIRTCKEFEGKWLDLLGDKYTPVGFIPPSFDDQEEEEEESETWGTIREWLDKQEDASVVYAGFGSEAKPTEEEIEKIGLGLETSGLPFVWVLRGDLLPPRDFEERTRGKGLVWIGWVPQLRLLAHRAVGGILTHGGWSSVVEGMVVGVVMVVLPMVFGQGLMARLLEEGGYAVEVERNDEDGSFCGEEIGRKLRMVMVEEEGEEVRKKARQGKEIFGCEKLHDKYIDELVKKLW